VRTVADIRLAAMPRQSRTDITGVADRIREARRNAPAARALLVAVTGIDGSGKGFVASRIVTELRTAGLRAEPINIDGWLNLPGARFNDSNPADHFYEHGIRFEELFTQLVLPLRDARSLRLEADFAEETATVYRRHVYEFTDLDVVVLEGIYLLKRAFVRHYDLSIWIECSFETALERAVARTQEGMPPDDTIHAYRTIYFPAQRLHFRRDNPKTTATIVLGNGPRLLSSQLRREILYGLSRVFYAASAASW